jgi:Tol biopolymer transport system component
MIRLRLSLIIIASAILFTSFRLPQKHPAPRIDMKDFFRNGTKSTFRISPDGSYYSYRADYKGKMNIFVQKAGGGNAVRVTNDTLRSIGRYFWKGDRIVYAQDIGGDENFQLFSVKVDGSDLKALTPFAGYRTDVIDDLKDITGRGKEIVAGINKRTKEYFDPYLINIETGNLTLLYDNKRNFDSWYIDNNGTIRMATKTDGVNVTYLISPHR